MLILTTSVSLTKISGRNRAILTIALLLGFAGRPILPAFPYLAHGYLILRARIVPDAVALPLNEPIACSHTVVVAVTL